MKQKESTIKGSLFDRIKSVASTIQSGSNKNKTRLKAT